VPNSIKEIYSDDYHIKDFNDNIITISLPGVTLGYLTFLRLEEVYVKVVNGKELKWNGVLYKRK
jgi:hypothetical protein